MSVQLYHGTIITSRDMDTLSVIENGYVIVQDGVIKDVLEVLPEEYEG